MCITRISEFCQLPRYTSTAIFKERYNVRSNGYTTPPAIVVRNDDDILVSQLVYTGVPPDRFVLNRLLNFFSILLSDTYEAEVENET